MVVKRGRFGTFLACPGFPECRNTKAIVEEAGVLCPICQGKVLIKKTKKGRKYIGCERNPECTFMNWDMPSKETCPICGSFMLQKSVGKKMILNCSNEKCTSNAEAVAKKEFEAKKESAAKKETAAKKESAAKKGSVAKKESAAKKGSTKKKESTAKKESVVKKESTKKKESTAKKESAVKKESTKKKESITKKKSTAKKESVVKNAK